MNRMEFMRQLEYLLRSIPENERMDALAYYNDYFDEAGVENEYRVIQELGSPEQVAESIISDYKANQYEEPKGYEDPMESQNQTTYQRPSMYQERKQKNTAQIVLIIILLILSSPIWGSVLLGVFCSVVGVVAGLAGAGIGLIVGGCVCFVAGILEIAVNALEGFATAGVGALLLSVGILLFLLFVLLAFKWIPMLVKVCVRAIKGLFHREEGGNEI